MSIDVSTTISEYVAGLALEAGKDKIKGVIDEKKLKFTLAAYIEKQYKYNELCSLAEEIDFQGLINYIRENFLEDAGTRFCDPNKNKRKRAREDIIAAAVEYSKAERIEAKKRVATCISICLDIIREFYKSQFTKKDYLLAGEIVDAVTEEGREIAQESVDTLSRRIEEAKDDIIASIDKKGSLFSIDKANALAEAGDLSVIGNDVTKLLEHISLAHPYKPYYGYDYSNGRLVSKPRNEEAIKLYPPKIVLTGTVRFGDQYYNDPQSDPLDYAYRHQLPLIMEISKAIKFLGEKTDPVQDEATDYVGNMIVITPPEFPPAFPCAIKVRDKAYFEYVLLRTQGIDDDGTYVISNKEQGGSLYFEVRINPHNPSNPDFKIKVDHTNNKEWLNYVRFMDAISQEKDIHNYVLSVGEDIIAGTINNVNYQSAFSSFDEEIDFLERVCIIEDYFNVSLDICGELRREEYNNVIQVSDLIRNDEVTEKWHEAVFTGIMTPTFRDKVLSMDDVTYIFSYVGVRQFKMFGTEIEYSYIRTYKNVRMKDLEKLKRKVAVLDDDDGIKFTVCAGEDNEAITSLKIPESMEEHF